MKNLLTRTLALVLIAALSLSALPALAEQEDAAALDDYVAENLSPEELAQWEEWALEDAQAADAPDANAAGAETLTAEDEEALSALAEALDDMTPIDEIDLGNLEPNELLPGNIVNILLLGVDNRTTKLQHGLSDAVIICSINRDTGSIKLTSIARDTAVVVPGYKSKKRINVAYKYGGPELAMKTVNRNFQMNVQRYIVVNIHGLADIIDALGGVDMDMTSREAGRINYELRKEPMDKVKREKVKAVDGVQHLDGMQAVTFARIRGIDSDLERTRRQRQLIETVLAKVMQDIDFAKMMTLVETALPHGETNLQLDEIIELGLLVITGEAVQNLQSGQPLLSQMRIPIDKKFGYKEYGGASLLNISDKNMKYTLGEMQTFIYGQSYLAD